MDAKSNIIAKRRENKSNLKIAISASRGYREAIEGVDCKNKQKPIVHSWAIKKQSRATTGCEVSATDRARTRQQEGAPNRYETHTIL